jgi:hypothetical protein
MRLLCLAGFLLTVVRSSRAIEWTVCEGFDPQSVAEVVLKPDPPSPGVTVDFAIKGTSGDYLLGSILLTGKRENATVMRPCALDTAEICVGGLVLTRYVYQCFTC